jgi:hypothetical protein
MKTANARALAKFMEASFDDMQSEAHNARCSVRKQ